MSDQEIPEGCRLVAHWTGDGWQLSVENIDSETVAYLEWPRSWPKFARVRITRRLLASGFEIV